MNEKSEQLLTSLRSLRTLYPKQSLEEVYVTSRRQVYRSLSKKFPVLYSHVFNKKYILPNYRLPDYHRAEACDYLMVDSLFGYLEGLFPASDHVSGHCISNFVASLFYNRPTFYLEKELGFPLLKGKLPDFYASDINWRWPAFRVYLPKKLLTMTKDHNGKPVTSHVMFLDITHVNPGELHLPPDIDQEFTKIWGPPSQSQLKPILLRRSDFEGLCVTCYFDFDAPESAIAYAASTKLENETIQSLLQEPGELLSPYKMDEIDNEFQKRMLLLTINILIFLGSVPAEYEPDHDKAIRNPKTEGKRLIPGLYPARFIGQTQLRAKQHPNAHVANIGTGTHLSFHWRSGHWRRQHYGPKNTPGKLEWIWIDTYSAGQSPDKDQTHS